MFRDTSTSVHKKTAVMTTLQTIIKRSTSITDYCHSLGDEVRVVACFATNQKLANGL